MRKLLLSCTILAALGVSHAEAKTMYIPAIKFYDSRTNGWFELVKRINEQQHETSKLLYQACPPFNPQVVPGGQQQPGFRMQSEESHPYKLDDKEHIVDPDKLDKELKADPKLFEQTPGEEKKLEKLEEQK
jgi:hypothetical protein